MSFKDYINEEQGLNEEQKSLVDIEIANLVHIQKQLEDASRTQSYDDIIRTIDKSLIPIAKSIKRQVQQAKKVYKK